MLRDRYMYLEKGRISASTVNRESLISSSSWSMASCEIYGISESLHRLVRLNFSYKHYW